MFYKHWKKIALSLTSLFWSACDDSASSTECLYGSPEFYGISSSEDSQNNPASSSSEAKDVSSSSETLKQSSSSIEYEAVPLYGVREYVYTCIQKEGDSTLTCGDGVTCKEETQLVYQDPECIEDICPDYGIVAIGEKTYTCDDGMTYNEAEFRTRYTKIIEKTKESEQDSTFKEMQPALYGPPCVFNGTCNDEKE